jgi:heme-degrading monooxygenase HmoA
MFARVSRYRTDEDTGRLLEGFQGTIGELQLVEGFSHAYFMVDKETGHAVSITVWESEGAMTASAGSAEERRQQRSDVGHASVESVDHYEIGLMALAPGVEPAGRRLERHEEPGEELV